MPPYLDIRPQRFALTRWFALAGAVGIGTFSVVMGFVLSNFLARSLLERDAAVRGAGGALRGGVRVREHLRA